MISEKLEKLLSSIDTVRSLYSVSMIANSLITWVSFFSFAIVRSCFTSSSDVVICCFISIIWSSVAHTVSIEALLVIISSGVGSVSWLSIVSSIVDVSVAGWLFILAIPSEVSSSSDEKSSVGVKNISSSVSSCTSRSSHVDHVLLSISSGMIGSPNGSIPGSAWICFISSQEKKIYS